MKLLIMPILSIAILLCSCSKESKAPDQPSSPLPAQPSAVRATASETPSDSDGRKHGLGDYVSFPACGIKIRQPEGFEKADSFDGFGVPDSRTSILAMSMWAPYSEAIKGLTQEQMNSRGVILQSREDVKVDSLPGILIHFEQSSGGQVFLKWSLAFGDEQKTTMVTATVPKTQGRELSARLKAAVLSTRLDRATPLEPGMELPFTITASPKLKLTPCVSKTLTYTNDGAIPAKSPKDPFFIAAPSIGEAVVGDKRRFSERQIRQNSSTKGLAVKSIDAITVDGLDGYELLAEAEHVKSGALLIVYQVVLFEEDSLVIMWARVGIELRDEYLPEFKAMARSFQKKRP